MAETKTKTTKKETPQDVIEKESKVLQDKASVLRIEIEKELDAFNKKHKFEKEDQKQKTVTIVILEDFKKLKKGQEKEVSPDNAAVLITKGIAKKM